MSNIKRLIEKVYLLTELKENWGSYGEATISPIAIHKALEYLFELDKRGYILPNIFPSPCGGIQLEWSISGIDLEVLIFSNGDVDAFHEDLESGISTTINYLPEGELLEKLKGSY